MDDRSGCIHTLKLDSKFRDGHFTKQRNNVLDCDRNLYDFSYLALIIGTSQVKVSQLH